MTPQLELFLRFGVAFFVGTALFEWTWITVDKFLQERKQRATAANVVYIPSQTQKRDKIQ